MKNEKRGMKFKNEDLFLREFYPFSLKKYSTGFNLMF